jgi:hypothetical protein
MAVPIGAVGTQERTDVELVDHVAHEPGEVVLGQPVAKVRGQQEGLVAVAAQEVVGHGASYLCAPLAPNVLVLESQLDAPAAPRGRLIVSRDASQGQLADVRSAHQRH